MTANSEITVQVARSLTEIHELRGVWQNLRCHPNADMDYYLAVLNSRTEIIRPHVIVLSRNETPVSLLIGRLDSKPFEVGLGYKKLPFSSARWLTFIYGGLLGDDSDECVRVMMASVMNSLRNREAEIVWFNQLKVDSALYRGTRAVDGMLSRDHFPFMNIHWKVQLPGSFEEFLRQRTSHRRNNLKRYAKRLKESFGDKLTIKEFREPSQIQQLLEDTEKVATKSYHRGLQAGFVNNVETQRLMALSADRKWLRAYVLYIDGNPTAFWNGLLLGKTFFTGTTGFDPAFRDYRLGTFLLERMIEDLCKERIAEAVDFGFGDAQYKKDLCDQSWEESSVYLFAPTFKGALLNGLRTVPAMVSNAAQQVLTKTGLLPRVKKIWRDYLTPRSKVETSNG